MRPAHGDPPRGTEPLLDKSTRRRWRLSTSFIAGRAVDRLNDSGTGASDSATDSAVDDWAPAMSGPEPEATAGGGPAAARPWAWPRAGRRESP